MCVVGEGGAMGNTRERERVGNAAPLLLPKKMGVVGRPKRRCT